MRRQPVAEIAWSTASLPAGVLVGALIAPEYLSFAPGGLSNFGADQRTVVPYTLALSAGSGFAYAAARHCPRETSRAASMASGIRVFATLLVLTLVSTFPYKANEFTYWTHVTVGTLLFGWLVLFGAWLALANDRNPLAVLLLTVLVAASLVAAHSFVWSGNLLPHSQLCALVMFGVLLMVQLRRELREQPLQTPDADHRAR